MQRMGLVVVVEDEREGRHVISVRWDLAMGRGMCGRANGTGVEEGWCWRICANGFVYDAVVCTAADSQPAAAIL